MARDAAHLASKLGAAAQGINRVNSTALVQIGVWGKGEMIAGAAAAGLRPGGNLPSHSKARWNARFDSGQAGGMMQRAAASTTATTVAGVAGTAGGVQSLGAASILLRYVGPVHWAFFGTSPRGGKRSPEHLILPRVNNRRQRKRKPGSGMLRTPYGPRPYVNHPGTTGRNTWPATKARLLVGGPRMWSTAQRSALFDVFRRL